jgi:hypothetical protein
MLWRDHAITIGSLESDKKGKKASKAIVKTVNVTTGRESARDKAFTEQNWGQVTRNYLMTIKKNLREDSWRKIIARAQAYAKLGRRPGEASTMTEMTANPTDERAQLIDYPDDEGKSSPSSFGTQHQLHSV